MRAPWHLVFDLETIDDPELSPPAARSGHDVGPPAPVHCKIVAASAIVLRPNYAVHSLRAFVSEPAWLRWYVEALTRKAGAVCLVGWGSRTFDAPVCAARCFRHGIAFPRYYEGRNGNAGDLRYRYGGDHLDLCDYLADHGSARSARLDAYCRAMGLPGKGDTNGGDVAAMVAEGRGDDVLTYNLSDTAQTTMVLLRTQYVRGLLDAEGYRTAMRGLLDALAKEPRLAPLVAAVRAAPRWPLVLDVEAQPT